MILTEERAIKRDVTIGWRCDVCGKKTNQKKIPNDWLRFDCVYHGQYPQDFQTEDIDVCSARCFIKFLIKEFQNGCSWEEIADMPIDFLKQLVNLVSFGK